MVRRISPSGRIGPRGPTRQTSQTSIPKTRTSEEIRQEIISKEKQRLKEETQVIQNRISLLKKELDQIEKGGVRSEEKADRNKVRDRISEARKELNVIGKLESQVERGVSAEDVLSAAQRESDVLRARKEQQTQQLQRTEQRLIQEGLTKKEASAIARGRDIGTTIAFQGDEGVELFGTGRRQPERFQIVEAPQFSQQTIVSPTQTELELQQSLPADIRQRRTEEVEEFASKPITTRSLVFEVQPAPTRKEKFKEAIEEKGKVTGTLSFLGSEASILAFRGQERSVRKFGGKFDPEFAELQGDIISTAPFFTPGVGPPLLIGSGIESFTSKEGKRTIESNKEFFEEKGFGTRTSSFLATTPSIAQVGLGVVGVKTRITKARTLKDIKGARTTFVAKETKVTDTTSRVDVFSQTQIGKKKVFGVSSQEVFKVGDKFAIGGTKGFIFTQPKPTLRFPLGTLETKTSVFGIESTTFSQSLGGVRRGIKFKESNIFIPTKARGVQSFTIGKVTDRGGTKFLDEFTEAGVGGFEQKGSLFFFKGGKEPQLSGFKRILRIQDTGKAVDIFQPTTLRVKPTTRGILYRPTTDFNKPSSVGFRGGGKKSSKSLDQPPKTVQESVTSQVSSLEGATKTIIRGEIKTIPPIAFASTKSSQELFQPTRTLTTVTQTSRQNERSLLEVSGRQVGRQKDEQLLTPLSFSTTKTTTDQRTGLRTITIQSTKLSQNLTSARGFVGITPITTKTPKAPLVPITPFAFPSLELPPSKEKKEGYLPQAKTKGGKWLNLSKKPLSRQAALSKGARAVDNTTSARFRIKAAKGKLGRAGEKYFGQTQQKYRPYRIVQGRPIQLQNSFIEKRASRIDTPGEVKGLSLAKYVKQQGINKSIKPKKKRGKSKRSKNKKNGKT